MGRLLHLTWLALIISVDNIHSEKVGRNSNADEVTSTYSIISFPLIFKLPVSPWVPADVVEQRVQVHFTEDLVVLL